MRAPPDPAEALARSCVADLVAIHRFLGVNDAGIRGDPCRRAARAVATLRDVATRASQVQADGDHVALLREYLRSWRTGHLGVSSGVPGVVSHAPRLPSLGILSARMLLLTLPSFSVDCRAALEALLEDNRGMLETHDCWILDLRGNDGGADSTYEPLLDWLMPQDWTVAGCEFLCTAANADAHERLVQVQGVPDEIKNAFVRLTASMRSTPEGRYVRLAEEGDGYLHRQARVGFVGRPARVTVLIDGDVGSSGEQFLLEIRESPLVTLFGRPTAGVLDYSNLRPWSLPSGKGALWYATSRSLRLPAQPIDGVGVLPDRALPLPRDDAARAAEVAIVRSWLEQHGST